MIPFGQTPKALKLFLKIRYRKLNQVHDTKISFFLIFQIKIPQKFRFSRFFCVIWTKQKPGGPSFGCCPFPNRDSPPPTDGGLSPGPGPPPAYTCEYSQQSYQTPLYYVAIVYHGQRALTTNPPILAETTKHCWRLFPQITSVLSGIPFHMFFYYGIQVFRRQ